MEVAGTAHAGAWGKWDIKLGSLALKKENKAMIRSKGTANLFKCQCINYFQLTYNKYYQKRLKSSFILTK